MWLRILLGFPFVYLISGFPLARLFLPDERKISLKLFLTSFAFSLLLTYPAAVLTTIIEGQSAAAIYSFHLPHSLFSIGLISLVTFLVLVWKNKDWWQLSLPKITKAHFILGLIILLYSFFVFWNLGRADVVGDDYDLGYQAYNLQDGIQAARRAYILSFATHPPLFMTIKHYGMQLFSPFGLETLSDWMFRGVEGMMGIGTILAAYLLVSESLSQRTALITCLLLAVNNYLIFFGRYFEREIYYLPFALVAFYYCLNYLQSLKSRDLIISGLFLGCGLLIKASALIAVPPVLIILFLNKRSLRQMAILITIIFLVYTPIVLFNLLMYINTGYLDGTFSRIFHVYHPLNTGVPTNSLVVNPVTTFFLLTNLYGYPIMFFYLISLVSYFIFRYSATLFRLALLTLIFSGLFFMFSPMRAYYLIIFTLPLVIFTAAFTVHLIGKSKLFFLPLVILLIFSVTYAYNSNLVNHELDFLYFDIGSGGNYGILKDNFWKGDFSLAAAVFAPERGWKVIEEKIDRVFRPGDCLELQEESLDLEVRRYLQTHDLVKKALLGSGYHGKYPLCEETNPTSRRITIYYNQQAQIDLK